MLKKYIVDLLEDNPLNGINTYNDILTLSTGAIVRKINKLVLTGEENITSLTNNIFRFNDINDYLKIANEKIALCSHYVAVENVSGTASIMQDNTITFLASSSSNKFMYIKTSAYSTAEDFASFLSTQYAAGTPITVWYVLAAESTDQITVPTGLSGSVEGYTTQSGTPTPTTPIYPTANTVTMWAKYTPSRYNGIAFVTATGHPEQYNGGWT